MRKIITLIISILSFCYTQAQATAIEWQKSLGGTGVDFSNCIQPTADGGYVMAGYTGSGNGDVDPNGIHGVFDLWVVKLNASGNIQWQKTLGGSNYDIAYSIKSTSDGGYVVAGTSNSNDYQVSGNNGSIDCWVVKLDANGTIQWQKSLGGSFDDFAYSFQTTPDGGYIVAGASNSNDIDVTGNHGGADYWVVKLNSTGNIQWQKSLGGSNNDYAQSIQTVSDGGYVVAGYSRSIDGDVTGNHGFYDYWVVKLDVNGNIQWQKSLGGSGFDRAWAIHSTSDGGYVVVGDSDSNNGDVTGNHGGYPDYWVIKLDVSGNIIWQKSLGGSAADIAYSVQTTIDGGYIVCGSSSTNTVSNDGDITGNHSSSDYWVVKLDVSGNIVWQKSLGGSFSDTARSIQVTSDGGYVVAGYTESSDGNLTGNHGSYDCWVVKLGSELAIPVFDKQDIIIYPNPVCDVLQLKNPHNITFTKAKVIALNGKVVYEEIIQNTNTIHVENIAKGVYILEVYSGEEKYVSKFVKE